LEKRGKERGKVSGRGTEKQKKKRKTVVAQNGPEVKGKKEKGGAEQ